MGKADGHGDDFLYLDVRDSDDASFVHGLVQPFAVDYREDEEVIAWLRRPLHGTPKAIEGAEALSDLLGSMARSLSVALATVARSHYLPNAPSGGAQPFGRRAGHAPPSA